MPTSADTGVASDAVTVESATIAHLDAIGRLSFASAFFGAPAEVFFPAPSLFTELWVAPYLVAGHALVARVGVEVVGYCLGADHPGDYARGLRQRVPHVLRAFLGEPGRVRALHFGLRALATARPTAPADRFPGHLHLAVAAEARGAGLGCLLLRAYLSAARARGVAGIQLSTTDVHVAAIRLYRSEGFGIWEARASRLWQPWLGRPVRHLVMTLDLDRWEATREATPEAAAQD